MFDSLALLAQHFITALEPLVGSAAAAIVLGTMGLRLALVPAAVAAHRADLRRRAFMARIATLNEKYQHNKRRLQEEVTAHYRSESGGLIRGFLPMLVQIPVFAGLYRLFVSPTVGGHANALLQQTLFGAPLGAHLYAVTVPQLAVFAVLIALFVALGYASSRLLRPVGPAPQGVLAWVARVVPYAPVAALLFVPLAAGLFLVTSTAWTLVQTVILRVWA